MMEPLGSRWPLWCWWPVVVLALSAPLEGFTRHPQIDRINWMPFGDPDDKLSDLAGNIALYVPFGASFAGARRGRARFAQAVLAAGALSLSAEATQVFSTVRDPSATDVAAAVVGTCLGVGWRWR